jgi:hypothetical protein
MISLKTPRRNYRSTKKPYWNFIRVVFAGWMIRYPRQTVFLPLGILIVLIYNAVMN